MDDSADNVSRYSQTEITELTSPIAPTETIVVLTHEKETETTIKYLLGDSCDLATCSSAQALSRLVNRSGNAPPSLVLIRDQLLEEDMRILRGIEKRLPSTPIVVLSDRTNMQHVSRYMRYGARDAVSLDDADRLRAVIDRELASHRIRCAYDLAIAYPNQSKKRAYTSHNGMPTAANELMQIYNRDDFLSQIVGRLARTPSRGIRALAWIRPDQFSSVEDAVGVFASQDALTHIGTVLLDLMHPADLCGRFGGTVFTVLIERGTLIDVEAWVQQFCRCLPERPFVTDRKETSLSCSVGICAFDNSNDSIERVLQDARDACSRGRIDGDGKICLSGSSNLARSTRLRDRKWGYRIRSALRNDRFELGHSPVVRLDGRDEKIRDTWVRMSDKNGTTILATEFIPVAKRLGLMVHIDRWVIAATITYCTKRNPDLVFVRLSKNSMLDNTLAHWLEKLFRLSNIAPSQICFQTTAPVAARLTKQVIRQITRLTALGFKFSIDQIGSTPEMMAILQLIPLEYARIDSALLQQVAWNKSVHHQVSAIVRACRTRGIHAIAERVEDAATMAVLCQIGVKFMQGDYLRRDSIVMEDTVTVCIPRLPSNNIG